VDFGGLLVRSGVIYEDFGLAGVRGSGAEGTGLRLDTMPVSETLHLLCPQKFRTAGEDYVAVLREDAGNASGSKELAT